MSGAPGEEYQFRPAEGGGGGLAPPGRGHGSNGDVGMMVGDAAAANGASNGGAQRSRNGRGGEPHFEEEKAYYLRVRR